MRLNRFPVTVIIGAYFLVIYVIIKNAVMVITPTMDGIQIIIITAIPALSNTPEFTISVVHKIATAMVSATLFFFLVKNFISLIASKVEDRNYSITRNE